MKSKARLIYCQKCGSSQIVVGIVLPCAVCGTGTFKTTPPADKRGWIDRVANKYDQRFLRALRIDPGGEV